MSMISTEKNYSKKSNSEEKEYKYCLRCGRKLRNPEAKMRGMGKICAEKSKHETRRRLFDANCDT